METKSKTPKESNEDEPLSTHPKSKLSIISFVLGIFGSIIYWSSLLMGFYLMMAGGGLDILDFPREITFVMYGSFFYSVVGGVLGPVGLLRDENIVINTASFTLGALTLCTYLAVTLIAQFS